MKSLKKLIDAKQLSKKEQQAVKGGEEWEKGVGNGCASDRDCMKILSCVSGRCGLVEPPIFE